jgi:hypothetical protein
MLVLQKTETEKRRDRDVVDVTDKAVSLNATQIRSPNESQS